MPASTRSTSVTLRGDSSPYRDILLRLSVTILALGALAGALALSPYSFDFSQVWEFRGLYAEGLGLTVLIAVGGYGVGLVLGLFVAGARLSRRIWIRQIGDVYVELVRGTPFLAQIFIWRFGISVLLGLEDKLLMGILCLGVFAAAYIGEIIRAGIESIDRGQFEAARSLGLSRHQTLRAVVLPQAFKRMIPPLTGEMIAVTKESSLLMIIGVSELMFNARNAAASTYDSFEAFLLAAAAYLTVTIPLSLLARRLEHKLGRSARSGMHL